MKKNKQYLINHNYNYMAKKDDSIEVWAKWEGIGDMISYRYYYPKEDLTGSKAIASYSGLVQMFSILKTIMEPEYKMHDGKHRLWTI